MLLGTFSTEEFLFNVGFLTFCEIFILRNVFASGSTYLLCQATS